MSLSSTRAASEKSARYMFFMISEQRMFRALVFTFFCTVSKCGLSVWVYERYIIEQGGKGIGVAESFLSDATTLSNPLEY